MKFAVVAAAGCLLLACEIPLPGGKLPECGGWQVVDGSLVIKTCDAGVQDSGVSGSSGQAGGAGRGGSSGAGAGGRGGMDAGHQHGGAGAGGMDAGVAGSDAGHQHGGLPVLLPLPAGDPGTSAYRIRQANDFPGPAGDGVGAFRNVCEASHVSFDDAIVYPGQPGRAHAHTYFGNTKADAFSTYESLRSTGNSTCRGGIAARSAYWFPSLLDASGRVILPVEIHYYWKSAYFGLSPQQIQKYPTGLRAIVGDMTARAAQSTSSVWWDCVDGGAPRSATIISCGNGQVAMNAAFPQCWNGQLDSPDHKSHLVRPQGGRCPASHPTAIPELSIHVRYAPIPAGARLSSDASDGLRGVSNHMDFMDAWDPALPPVWLERCVRAGNDCGSHRLGDGRIME